jgi:hypothetical protein
MAAECAREFDNYRAGETGNQFIEPGKRSYQVIKADFQIASLYRVIQVESC